MTAMRIFLAVVLAVAGQQAAAIPMAWRVERASDPAMGGRSCALVATFGAVTARLATTPGAPQPDWSVTIGFDNQPGSLRYLRVDEAIFTSARERFEGAEAAEIVAHLKAPGEFAFEWAKRPDFAKQQGLFGTGDFAAKAAQCEDWIKGPRAARRAYVG